MIDPLDMVEPGPDDGTFLVRGCGLDRSSGAGGRLAIGLGRKGATYKVCWLKAPTADREPATATAETRAGAHAWRYSEHVQRIKGGAG